MASAEYSPAVLRTRPVATGHWRAFLAVARAGTLSGAASAMAVGIATVSRRIERLEGALAQTGQAVSGLVYAGVAGWDSAEYRAAETTLLESPAADGECGT